MVHSARAKTWSAIGLTLALLVCTSGGCVTTPCSGLPGCGACCLFPFHGCAHQQSAVSVVDPVCHGYHATCWCPWPDQCGGCPTDPLRPLAAPTSTSGENEAGAIDGSPSAAPVKPPSPGGKSVDLELLPLPDSGAIDEPAPPPELEGEKPAKKQGEGPAKKEGERPTKKEGERPPEKGPPSPPTQDSTTTKAGQPTLRVVSYSRAIVVTPNKPKATPERLWEQTARPDQSRTPGRNLDLAPASPQADRSSLRAEQEDQTILDALRMSFSPPARPHPPAEGPSAPPGN